jgi:uncharacterized protein YqeY
MKTIKETIQDHFVVAMKAKDETAKSALSGIKAKITEAEKANGNKELSDDEVIKVLSKAIKQRRESQEIYEKAGRGELARKETDEACVLERYMPSKMSPQEITDALIEIMQGFSGVITNPNALQGKTIGEFNKRYNGRADIGTVKMLLSNLVEV